MNIDTFVALKLNEARHSSDPHEILHIAHQLESVSAWEAARECERLAEAAERKLADEVNK
jgi:hypothetical protein